MGRNTDYIADESDVKDVIDNLDLDALESEIPFDGVSFHHTSSSGELGIEVDGLPRYVHELGFAGTDHGRVSASDLRETAENTVDVVEDFFAGDATFDDFCGVTDSLLFGGETYHGWRAWPYEEQGYTEEEFMENTTKYAYAKAKTALAIYDALDL